MQMVRTEDLIRYGKEKLDQLKIKDQASRDKLKALVEKHKQTIWYRWFGYEYEDCGYWTHYHTSGLIDDFEKLLAKAEYNQKMNWTFVPCKDENFFVWAKANNVPF